MKTVFSHLICISAAIICSLSVIAGCGGSSGSSAGTAESGETKAANVEAPSDSEPAVDSGSAESVKKAEKGDEFHVGDSFLAGDMKVVYVCSGEYYSDNMFMQPENGFKYIYLKLYCENTGKSDESMTSFDFECYADGYSMKSVYFDDSLSASLSSGRSSEGFLYYEIPADAREVEIEYSLNLFSDSKIKLIYEGELYSDFVAETNSSASENAFTVGQTAEGDLNITFVSCYEYYSDNEFMQPKEGFRYITFEFEVENVSSSDHFISDLSFQCYADGVKCDGFYGTGNELSAELSSGRKASGTVSFEVPADASVIEAEYEDNFWTDSKIIFLYSE